MTTKAIIQAKFNGRRLSSGTNREMATPAKLQDLVRLTYETKKINLEKEQISR